MTLREMSMNEEAKQNVWVENYERLHNFELARTLIICPMNRCQITFEMVKKVIS